MRNFSINKKDLEEIERLLRITTNVDKLYKKLLELEIDNKKYTIEYSKHLEYLSIFLEEEEKLYNKIEVNTLLSKIKFLYDHKRLNSFDIIENIMIKKNDDNILIRVITSLLSKITNNQKELTKLSNKELTNIMIMYGMNKTKKLSNEEIIKRIVLKNITENDILYTFLYQLQKQTNMHNQKTVKNSLIEVKYNLAFINKNIERYLLSNKFNIEENIYTLSTLNLPNIDEKLYTLSKDALSVTIANNQIYELLEINDIDYNDINKVITVILRECMLNSSLTFISKDMIEEIKIITKEYIENEEYEFIHSNNNISKILINNCLNNTKENKSKKK